MLKNEIVNDNYKSLNGNYEDLIKSYINEEPFPNIELKNFFNEEFLNKVLNEFPDLSKKRSENYNNKNEIKFANNDYNNFSPNIKLIFNFVLNVFTTCFSSFFRSKPVLTKIQYNFFPIALLSN